MQEPVEKFELRRPVWHLPGVRGEPPTDADLVHAARAGDGRALGALLDRHRAGLYACALSILGDPTEAEDAVQDTLLTALARLGQLEEPAAVGGWLRSVVRNACLMRIRARRAIPTADPEPRPGLGLEVEEALDRAAVADWVWTAIGRLPEDQAVAVVLRYFSRATSYQQIAALLGVPVGTVRSRLNQARHRLASELLRTAARVHTDHGALVGERTRWWRAATDELHEHGTADLYAADCAADVLVEEFSTGYHVRGIDDHRRGVEESVAAGVRMRPAAVWASDALTVAEGDYLNPPDDPRHCPATHTEVRIHPAGRTTRLLLYYRSHADLA